MALPVIAVLLNTARTGVMAVIDYLIGWFGKNGILAGFFTQLGVKLTSKSFIIAFQIATSLTLVASHIALGVAIYEVYQFISNALIVFKEQLPTLMTQNDLMSLAYNFMRSVGLIDAFKDSFALFNVLLFSLVVATLAKLAFKAMKLSADEYFKLSVLTQQ